MGFKVRLSARRFPWAAALVLSLAVASTPLALAQVPAGPTVLSRENMLVNGSLVSGASAAYTVNYQPMMEALSKPSPWLLRMYFSAPGSTPGGVAFSWVDQTSPTAQMATAGSTGTSSTPQIGGNATDVPSGTDTSTIQQAVLSGGSDGTFAISVFNSSNVMASYTLHLYPLLGGVLETGLNPNPTPIAAASPTAAPAPQPAPAAPPAPVVAPVPPPFTPFWVKTLRNRATLYSDMASPPGLSFGTLPQFSCLQVGAPQTGPRLYVLNPATTNYAYVNASDVGALASNDKSCG